jgi:hypothetical protein
LWFIGLAAGAWLVAVGLTDDVASGHRVTAVLWALVGWSFVASGLVAWRRRPSNRLGPLMVVLGLAWSAGHLAIFSHSALVYTAAIWVRVGWVVLLVLFLVSFPEGHLVSRTGMLLVVPFALVAGPAGARLAVVLGSGLPAGQRASYMAEPSSGECHRRYRARARGERLVPAHVAPRRAVVAGEFAAAPRLDAAGRRRGHAAGGERLAGREQAHRQRRT